MNTELEKIVKQGFIDLKIGFGECDIYAKGDKRIVYNPTKDEVVSHYSMNHHTGHPFSIRYVQEIIQAIEHLKR